MTSSHFQMLSKTQARVAALKNILIERNVYEKELEMKINELHIQYQKKFNEFHEKSKAIIQGKEVTLEDCKKFLSLLPPAADLKQYIGDIPIQPESYTSLKDYWLIVLKNFSLTSPMINPHDEHLLSHLTHIRAVNISPGTTLPDYPQFTKLGIIIEFHFSKNEYFSNSVLYKYYQLECVDDKKDPLKYIGLMPVKIECSNIDWSKEKNLTVTCIKKTQKNKKTKQMRVVNKIEKRDSFFNFFSSLQDLDIKEIENEEDRQIIMDSLMASDYDIASEIQLSMIPMSVRYFMNELFEDEEYSDEDTEDEDDDSDDNCSSGSDQPKFKAKQVNKKCIQASKRQAS